MVERFKLDILRIFDWHMASFVSDMQGAELIEIAEITKKLH